MRNPYTKLQNISIHGSKVMLCTRKRDKGKNDQTNKRTDKPEAICFFQYASFKVGDIKSSIFTFYTTPLANSAEDKSMIFFYYFSQQTGFDIACKLSPLETICMTCQNLFSG